jgi:hypothetical protein
MLRVRINGRNFDQLLNYSLEGYPPPHIGWRREQNELLPNNSKQFKRYLSIDYFLKHSF